MFRRSQVIMSESEEQPKLDLDLGSAFLPSWAQKPAKENPYEKYDGNDSDRPRRRDQRRQGRSDRPDRPRSNRSQDRRRPAGDRDSNRRPQRNQDSKHRSHSGAPQNRTANRQGGRSSEGRAPGKRRSREEILASLPNLKVTFVPDQKGVESLAKQIRMQGRAYPLFDIASLVLKRPDRFKVSTSLQTDGKGQAVSEQWRCRKDDTLWLSKDEAVDHVLKEYFDEHYEKLKTETAPPNGNFTFVAQCGISGKILGPPNYHGYQDALRALHAQRFSRMHFDAYKERVKIVREEETVKQWIEEQSWKTQYQSKSRPDAAPMDTWGELVADFEANHLEDLLENGKLLTLSAAAGLKTPSRPVQELIRFHVEDQRRFPLQVATVLSQMFARQGLQFFKVNRTITHVSVARPKFLDMMETPVSNGVQRIVEFIDATPDCTRKKLFDALKPASPAAPEPKDAPSDPSSAIPQGEDSPQAAAPSGGVSPEETAIITDLHWLIHQGHVIEFSNGKMETAKKPAPRPEKSEKSPSKPNQPKMTPAGDSTEAADPTPSTAPRPVSPPPGDVSQTATQPEKTIPSVPSETVAQKALAPTSPESSNQASATPAATETTEDPDEKNALPPSEPSDPTSPQAGASASSKESN